MAHLRLKGFWGVLGAFSESSRKPSGPFRKPFGSLLGAFGEPFGSLLGAFPFWEPSGGVLEAFWALFPGAFWKPCGKLLAVFRKPSGSFLEALREYSGSLLKTFRRLGAFWEPSGSLLGAFWEPSGSLLKAFREPSGSLHGSLLGAFRGSFWELSRKPFEPFKKPFGSLLGAFWEPSGSFLGGFQEPFWLPSGSLLEATASFWEPSRTLLGAFRKHSGSFKRLILRNGLEDGQELVDVANCEMVRTAHRNEIGAAVLALQVIDEVIHDLSRGLLTVNEDLWIHEGLFNGLIVEDGAKDPKRRGMFILTMEDSLGKQLLKLRDGGFGEVGGELSFVSGP
eukprot:s2429_g3.t1